MGPNLRRSQTTLWKKQSAKTMALSSACLEHDSHTLSPKEAYAQACPHGRGSSHDVRRSAFSYEQRNGQRGPGQNLTLPSRSGHESHGRICVDTLHSDEYF